MITPLWRRSIAGSRARSRRTAGSRLRSSSRCHCASSSTAKPPLGADEPPRTWTMMSTSPSRCCAAVTRVAQPSAVVRSACTNRSAGSSLLTCRAHVSTCAPSARNSSTTARPTPLLPPVTSTRLPLRSRFMAQSPACGSARPAAETDGSASPGCQESYRPAAR